MNEKETILYKGVMHGDWVDCMYCGKRMLLPEGGDICPECRTENMLRWVNEEQEKDADDLHSVKQSDRELGPHEYLTAESLRELFPDVYRKMVDEETIRCCKICGKPMAEGYYCDDDFYCSDECLHKDVTQEEIDKMKFQLEEGERVEDLSEEEKECRFYSQDVFYYTQWESCYNM